jgi:hypothetical protein
MNTTDAILCHEGHAIRTSYLVPPITSSAATWQQFRSDRRTALPN